MWDFPGLGKAFLEFSREVLKIAFPDANQREKNWELKKMARKENAKRAFREFLRKSNNAIHPPRP